MNKIIQFIEKREIKNNYPNFRSGDTIKVHFKIIENDKERIQIFQGLCIAIRRGGARASIVVRKISFSHGVERIFPLSSPRISKIEIIQSGKVRRAKLYYIRDLKGKKARIKEKKRFLAPEK